MCPLWTPSRRSEWRHARAAAQHRHQQQQCQSKHQYCRRLNRSLKKEKNKWVAVLLCLFLGVFGGHKFYEGKIGMGILYILTLGLFGIGAIIDLIVLLFKPNPYYV